MPFKKKLRKCERCLGEWVYKPAGKRITSLEVTELQMDELEAMRLCDSENLSQKDAADKMEISSGTLQRLLYSARKKIVDSFCNQYAIELKTPLNIEYKNDDTQSI